jgi:hypothetical protein
MGEAAGFPCSCLVGHAGSGVRERVEMNDVKKDDTVPEEGLSRRQLLVRSAAGPAHS